MSEFCRVSVIFELDNASFEDYPVWSSRLLGLMRWVCLSVPAETVEFIVVHAGSSAIDKFLAMLPDELGSRVVILDLAGLPASYYQMKNAGAQIAAGQLLVFLDSDLVPVCGDFSDLLAPVIENKCMVACGHTFFPTDTFLERCYAVFWMFPIFKFPETIGKYQLFVSSTVVPKQWFIEFGSFPQVGGLRASCTLFSRALQRAGYSIAHPDVWFRHALWDDRVSFFIWRALAMGRNADKKQAHASGLGWRSRAAGAARHFRMDIGRLFKRHVRYGRKVGLGPLGCLASFSIGVGFFTLVRSAQLVEAIKPVGTAVERVPEKYLH